MKSVKRQFIFYRLSQIFRPGLNTWGGCALAAAGLLSLAYLIDPAGKYCPWFNIPAGILLAGGFAGFVLRSAARYEKQRATARKFDQLSGSFNRFETYLELKNSGHPLEHEHAASSRLFFRTFRLPFRTFSVAVSLAAALLFTGLDLALMARAGRLHKLRTEYKEEQAQAEEKQKAEEEKQKELAAETARLIITAPEESELRAKPLDELDWEGTGESPHGFTAIALSVYVNAEFHSNVPPEELPGQNGRIRFGSFLALEDFGVKPFDLVSYHLTGEALVGGEKRTILSEPGFIEVRPFREDVFTGDSGELSAEGLQAIDILNAFLNRQLALNKALFALKIHQANPDEKNPVDPVKVHAGVTARQQELAGDLDHYLQNPETRRMPADIVNHLELAHQDMIRGVKALEEKDIDQGLKHQQKAIANLIQAMKNIRKLLLKSQPEGLQQQEENPFKDKQKFKLPELDEAENLHNRLKQLLEEQKNLNEEIKKHGQGEPGKAPEEMVDAQGAIHDKTDQLKEKSPPSAPFRGKLEQGMESMEEAAASLRGGKMPAASLKGQKAAANLAAAMKLLEKASDEATRKTLDETREKLDRLSGELDSGQKNPSQVQNELSGMPAPLARAMEKQGQAGTMENAGKLGKLAERINQSAESCSSGCPDGQPGNMGQELKELKDFINEMRMGAGDPVSFLESAAGKLGEQSRHLKYAAGNPDDISPGEAAEIMSEMKTLLDDIALALARLEKESSAPGLREMLAAVREKSRLAGAAISTTVPEGEQAAAYYRDASRNAAHVVSLLAEVLAELKRDLRVYIFNADDVPPKYRKAAAEYFERLSNPEPRGGR